MAGDYALEGLAVPAALDLLHDLLERVGSENPDVSVVDLMLFETAVIEIAGNVVEHGRPPGDVTYNFDLSVRPDRLEAVLVDHGLAMVESIDREMPDGVGEGGRGLALAAAALDELSYSRADNRNCWTMKRLRN